MSNTSFFLPGLRRRATLDDLYGPPADGSSAEAPAPLTNAAFAPPGAETSAALAPVRLFPKPRAMPSAAAYAPTGVASQLNAGVPAAYQPAPPTSPTGNTVPYMGQSSAAFLPPPKPSGPDYGSQLADIEQKLSAAYAAPKPGLARQIIGGVLTGMNPRNPLGSYVSGAAQRQQQIQPLTDQYSLLQNIIQANRQQALNEADVANKNASTGYFNAETQAKINPPIKPKEEDWSVVPNVSGPNGEPVQQEKNSGQVRVVPLAGASRQEKEKTPNEKEQAISDYLEGKKLPNTAANRDRARSILATRDRPPKDPEVADLSKQLKQAQLEKLKEPTADEQRRADLANNLDENLTQLEDIARRRPELFGPLSGRLTSARQWIGPDDADVAALKNIEEQTGLAMVGAHAMRNAQHAEKAAQSITGANKNTAAVLLAPNGPIATARKSLQTFRADAGRRRAQIDAVTGTTEPTTTNPAANVLPSFAEWDKQNP